MNDGLSIKSKVSIFRGSGRSSGFTLVEILIVLAILGVITTLAIIGISQIRSSFSLANNGDILRAHLEKAFTDARRRHGQGSSRSVVRITGNNTYQARIDFDGDGNVEPRTITLTDGVRFIYDPSSPPIATIDWRGNIAEGEVTFVLRSRSNETLTLTLSSKGDSSSEDAPAMPVVTATTTSDDVKAAVVVNGNVAHNPNPSPTPALTPLPVCTSAQLPLPNNCRCLPGKIVDSDGKCK